MDQTLPSVSCIMRTIDRRPLAEMAIDCFKRQYYAGPLELIILDDGDDKIEDLTKGDDRIRYLAFSCKMPVHLKMKEGNDVATGEIRIIWDDDDYHGPARVGIQARNLQKSGADVNGLDRLYFYDGLNRAGWLYSSPHARPWVAGGTFAYTAEAWDRSGGYPVVDKQASDWRWLWGPPEKKIEALADNSIYLASIHPGNSWPRKTRRRPPWQAVDLRALADAVTSDAIAALQMAIGLQYADKGG